MSNNINPINIACRQSIANVIDEEYKCIIRKLQQYGLRPSGSKTTDRMRLHERELQEAQKENCITSKFLTVTKAEQEKIQEKKNNKKEEINPESNQNSTKGQEILGSQIMFAIDWRKKKAKGWNLSPWKLNFY